MFCTTRLYFRDMIDPIQGNLITLITNSEIKKRNELLIIAPQG
jgi:hypothetical protein